MIPKLTLLRKYYNGLFHISLITMIYSFWFIYSYKSVSNWYAFLQLFLYATVYVLITYFEVYYIFRKFFLKGKVPGFIAASLLLFLIGSILLQSVYAVSWDKFLHSFVKPDFYIETVVLSILGIFFSGLGITFTLFKMLVASERKISELAQANMKAELENLKKQVSPHFLFNTLNNLHVLAKTRPSIAANSILELADLLKYQLYECSNERVPLKREVEYIRSLLALELLRKDNWTMNLHFPNIVPETLHIEPLIFITLIENAIKHGSQQLHAGIIEVRLLLSKDQLVFEIVNSKPINKPAGLNRSSIGLNNLKRRLEILYPGKHSLDLSENVDKFTAKLILNL